MFLRLLLINALGVSALTAQSPRVSGTVFDSVAMAPLSGAIVQLALVDSGSGQRVFTTTSDPRGRFTFADVPGGRYGIGFQHAALNALGLEAPLRAFRLEQTGAVEVDLAIPPGTQVRALTCGGSATDSTEGLLAGYVIDAARGTPLTSATVNAHWVELGIVEKKIRAVPRDISTPVREDGSFHACGIAADAQVDVTVTRAGFRPLATDVTLPPGGALRYDVRLVDTALTRGTASIRGRVTHADGTPVAAGQVHLTDLALTAPIADGAFMLSNLPPGTWSLEARVIGYEPQTVLVDAVEGAPATVAVKVANKIQLLDAVTVFGKGSGNLKVLNDIMERRRTAFGTTFLPGNDWLRSALYLSDVLQVARGFRYFNMESVNARGCMDRTSIMGFGPQKLLFYIDGSRFNGDLSELQHMVPVRDILAVEAYPDPQSIPALYRSSDACAAVLVWTKRQ